jgi:hypothetical protein
VRDWDAAGSRHARRFKFKLGLQGTGFRTEVGSIGIPSIGIPALFSRAGFSSETRRLRGTEHQRLIWTHASTLLPVRLLRHLPQPPLASTSAAICIEPLHRRMGCYCAAVASEDPHLARDKRHVDGRHHQRDLRPLAPRRDEGLHGAHAHNATSLHRSRAMPPRAGRPPLRAGFHCAELDASRVLLGVR